MSILQRRYPHLFLKNPAEIILIPIPHIRSNIADAHISLGKQPACSADSLGDNIFIGGHSGMLTECSPESRAAHMLHPGQNVNINISPEVTVNIFNCQKRNALLRRGACIPARQDQDLF